MMPQCAFPKDACMVVSVFGCVFTAYVCLCMCACVYVSVCLLSVCLSVSVYLCVSACMSVSPISQRLLKTGESKNISNLIILKLQWDLYNRYMKLQSINLHRKCAILVNGI